MMLALTMLCALQDNEYVQKLDKVKYNLATRACREAERKLDSDETAAIDRLTRIIDDPEISKKECNLFVQQTDQYDPPVAFLPYQFRARARISLATKAGSPAEKKRLLDEAVHDLEESVRRNVKSSAPYLEAAQAELRRLATGPGRSSSSPRTAISPPGSWSSARARAWPPRTAPSSWPRRSGPAGTISPRR